MKRNSIDYDLAVAFRVYPKVSKEPLFRFNNKLELVKLGLQSFRKSCGNLNVKLWILLDGCPPNYRTIFETYFPKKHLEFINLPGVGNLQTFQKQIEILSSQNKADVVLFAEDDYLYLPDRLPLLVKFIQTNPNCFLTPYDHLSYYQFEVYQQKNSLKLFRDYHFRTGYSTCLTFLTSRHTLNRTRKIFESYSKGNHDASLWFSLTKPPILNPFRLFRHPIKNRIWMPLVFKAWRYCWQQIFWGRQWQLWCPVPSVATHLDKPFIAPVIDWKQVKTGLEKEEWAEIVK